MKPKTSQLTHTIGLIVGAAAAVIIYLLPLEGLTRQGQTCLSLTIMAVLFWAFQVAQPGYISGLLLTLMVVLNVADPSVVFYSWSGTTMYLIIGAYLIASAVKKSGLGERIAYWITWRMMRGYASMIVSIFVMTFVLSLIIPHPWPRAFLIMSVMAEVIKTANIPRKDAVYIGFAVFTASVPVSTIFLTGDSTINPLAVRYTGLELGWFDWLKIMGPPALIAAVLVCVALILMFRPSKPITVDREAAKQQFLNMGKLNSLEIRTLIWLGIAVALWVTDSLHGINIGWITLLIAMLMAMPKIGGLLTPKSWSEVPVQVLLFITAAMAIGKVGTVTGMNEWIATMFLPSVVPANPLLFGAVVGVIAILIHMCLGSVIAVMGVAIPAILAFTAGSSISPVVPTFMVFTAIVFHYIFPFQNMSILVGVGEESGLYSQKESIKFSIPLLIITMLVIIFVEVPWWKLLGLL